MRQFTTVELLRDLKTVTHAAARAPVGITQHRKTRFVLMAVEDFERLRGVAEDPRRVFAAGEGPPDIEGLLDDGLDLIIEGQESADGE